LKAELDNISPGYVRTISLVQPWIISIIFTVVRCVLGLHFVLTGASIIVPSAVLFILPILISQLTVLLLYNCPMGVFSILKNNNIVIEMTNDSQEMRVMDKYAIRNANDVSPVLPHHAENVTNEICGANKNTDFVSINEIILRPSNVEGYSSDGLFQDAPEGKQVLLTHFKRYNIP
jgi:hypothetical protein